MQILQGNTLRLAGARLHLLHITAIAQPPDDAVHGNQALRSPSNTIPNIYQPPCSVLRQGTTYNQHNHLPCPKSQNEPTKRALLSCYATNTRKRYSQIEHVHAGDTPPTRSSPGSAVVHKP
ncbi:hypothetical protein COCVIDRAFT_15439 [Bipolaris victoriae FI3]|uniref:Uncharacterized protein n=1 Tax=Bipolaris victoriae (strain FI3) TaxID=930091 RepID=W7EB95_BIPV3|nr:hypothetical protein COCVIDRAFT_15439 [Bipolaris victoriae FI3]